MELKLQAINFDANERLAAFIQKKADRISRHNPAITRMSVKLTVVKPETSLNKEAVIKLTFPPTEYVATKVADTFEEAIDTALDALARQTERRKE